MLQINSEKQHISYRLNEEKNFEFQENSECNSPLEGASAAPNAIFSEQEVDLLPADSEEALPSYSAIPTRDSQISQSLFASHKSLSSH